MSSDIAKKVNSRDNLDFLPAALEVLESPPAPFGRIIALLISAFFALAVLWAWFGTIDVVTIAQGQTVPTGKVKIVQPLETGVVKAIHVDEGQFVEAGSILIELDPTDSSANIDSLKVDLSDAKLDVAIGSALLEKEPVASFDAPKGVDVEQIEAAKLLTAEEFRQHQAMLSALNSEIEKLQASIRSSEIEKEKLLQTIPLIEERLEIQIGLLSKGITEKPVVIALKQELLEQKAGLANSSEFKIQNLASIKSLNAKKMELVAAFRTKAQERYRKGLHQVAVLEQNLKKEEQRNLYLELRAPVAGFVNQLAVHTIGAVVNTADRLLTIVPENVPLMIEAMVLNKDIGFVEPGQEAEIKLEAFPFTRFGTLKGQLVSVSNDAIINDELGPVYKAKVKINSQQMRVEGKSIKLSPGMNVSVEIKTGKRRIIDFFLSPLLRYQDEAIRER